MSVKKYAIVTGGNTGLGLQTTIELTKLGYHVTITVRSEEKGNAAVASILKENGSASIDFKLMNLSSLATVVEFSQLYMNEYTKLDLLINNAGIMATPFEKTIDGFESQFQVNHLAHFLLTHQLLPLLKSTGNARIVNLSSRAHLRWQSELDMNDVVNVTEDSYDRWLAYGRSKLCNILFTRALAERFPYSSSGVTVNALHPGLVNTNLLQNAALGASTIAGAIPVEEGIRSIIYLATATDMQGLSGQYYFDCQVVVGSDQSEWAKSKPEADKLWSASLKFCNIIEEEFGI